MLHFNYINYTLKFRFEAITSRNSMWEKPTSFFLLRDSETPGIFIGECSTIPGLSIDPDQHYEKKLKDVCARLNSSQSFDPGLDLNNFPSIRFGLECLKLNYESSKQYVYFDTPFVRGREKIPINGLVWMGNISKMKDRIREKIDQGFRCIKLKIGALNFEDELMMLKQVRALFSEKDLELRLDANGAFAYDQALEKLKILSDFGIHSIEQPIKAGMWEQMADVCAKSPVKIALDEELIGVAESDYSNLLKTIQPAYIILKPSLLGGFDRCEKWVSMAQLLNIGWWATSALESNIGLNAIAQWTSKMKTKIAQGLGTGGLYSNNAESPLEIIKGGYLHYNPQKSWSLPFL